MTADESECNKDQFSECPPVTETRPTELQVTVAEVEKGEEQNKDQQKEEKTSNDRHKEEKKNEDRRQQHQPCAAMPEYQGTEPTKDNLLGDQIHHRYGQRQRQTRAHPSRQNSGQLEPTASLTSPHSPIQAGPSKREVVTRSVHRQKQTGVHELKSEHQRQNLQSPTHRPIPSPTPPPEDCSSPKASQDRFPFTPGPSLHYVPLTALPPTPPPSAPRIGNERQQRDNQSTTRSINLRPRPDGELMYATTSSLNLDTTRLGALDKAQRFWELQNDVSTEGVPTSEKEARLEMLGRDLISDLHHLIEAAVAVENVLKGERWKVWSTGATIAAGIPAFCFLTQYPSLPLNFDTSKFTSKLSSLPSKAVSTLHSIPSHPMSRAAGRTAGAVVQASGRAVGKAATTSTAANEGFMALSAATLALSLVPTAIGAIEVAFHERKLGDVQSWAEDLRHLIYRVGSGETIDGMDMYCLSDDRWDELPWKGANEDTKDLCY